MILFAKQRLNGLGRFLRVVVRNTTTKDVSGESQTSYD